MNSYKKTYLLSAYALRPGSGSEPGVGWEWLCALVESNRYELICLAESEWRSEIEKIACQNNFNVEFHFLSIGSYARRLCWNQGSWGFYFFYRLWQIRAYIYFKFKFKRKFDVVHHLTLTGYREPGLLWMLKPEKFVLGPIGGLNKIPKEFLIRNDLKMRIKNKINFLSLYDPYVRTALRRADVLLASNSHSQKVLSNLGFNSILENETGVGSFRRSFTHRSLDVIWVGKRAERKRFDIFHKVVSDSKFQNLRIQVFGFDDLSLISGPIERVAKVSREEVLAAMIDAKVLLFPSIDEGTPWSMMEAIASGCAVLAHKTAGMADILPDEWLVELVDEEYSKLRFSELLENVLKDYEDGKWGGTLELCKSIVKDNQWSVKVERVLDRIENV